MDFLGIFLLVLVVLNLLNLKDGDTVKSGNAGAWPDCHHRYRQDRQTAMLLRAKPSTNVTRLLTLVSIWIGPASRFGAPLVAPDGTDPFTQDS